MSRLYKLILIALGGFQSLFADLVLYSSHHCPFCQRVQDYLHENHKSVPTRYTDDHPEIKQELIQIGGKGQVPCLVIDGYPLYGSNAIIEWMKTHPERLQDEFGEKATN